MGRTSGMASVMARWPREPLAGLGKGKEMAPRRPRRLLEASYDGFPTARGTEEKGNSQGAGLSAACPALLQADRCGERQAGPEPPVVVLSQKGSGSSWSRASCQCCSTFTLVIMVLTR